MWNLRRVLPGESPENLKEDERPRIFPPREQRYGEVQKVRPLLPALPGLRHCRFGLIGFLLPISVLGEKIYPCAGSTQQTPPRGSGKCLVLWRSERAKTAVQEEVVQDL
jgi:hypothetical protein